MSDTTSKVLLIRAVKRILRFVAPFLASATPLIYNYFKGYVEFVRRGSAGVPDQAFEEVRGEGQHMHQPTFAFSCFHLGRQFLAGRHVVWQ